MTTLSFGISITDHEGKIVRKNACYDSIVAGKETIRIGERPYAVCTGWLKNFGQVLQEKDSPAMQAITAGKPVMGIEIDVQRLDGSFVTIYESAKPIMDTYGRIAGATVITQDITQPIQQERLLFGSLLRQIQNNHDFRALAKTMPQLVWTASITGSIHYFNDYVDHYQGFQRQEDRDWNCAEALYPEDLPETARLFQQSIETGVHFKIQHRLRMADGTYRWHDSQMIPIPGSTDQTVWWLGMARDIHEQKMIEQALLYKLTATDGKL